MATLAERPYLLYPVAAFAAAMLGAITTMEPKLAAGLLAAAGVAWVAWGRPVANLLGIVFLTALVPFSVQKAFGVSGPGGIPSDLLLFVGIAWGVLTIARMPLDRRWLWFAGPLAVYLVLAFLQALHGFAAGHNVSDVGVEFRVQLGFGAFLIAVPIVRDPVARARLLKGLLGIALVLGLWGLVQYVVTIPFTGAEDVGVREGVALTSGGRGQVQGGLYGFGVAVVMCASVLLSGVALPGRARLLVLAALAVNAGGLLLTFERTFWVATVAAVGLLVVRSGRVQRLRALFVLPIAVAVAFTGLAVVAPGELTTARERLVSIGQYGNDNSVRYRVVESRHVIDQIQAAPIVGKGFGATVYWGQSWYYEPPRHRTYTHNGFLWLMWKMGIPAALMMFAIVGLATVFRRPPALPPLERALRNGAQAALLSLLVSSITFPVFNTLAISAVIGVLLALAVAPPRPEEPVQTVRR